VLVEAAAGGVGSLLLQLARGAGARVVATSGGPRKVALTRDLGAPAAVDYTQAGWPDRVRAEAGPVDVVFDGVGGQIREDALGLLRPGGRLLAYGGASGAFTPVPDDEAARCGITVIRGAPVSAVEMSDLTRAALAGAAAGRLRPVTGQTFPLERAADAHAAIEARSTIGKTLLLTRAGAADPAA
jgi:NADPH:quinone reductase